MEDDPIDLQALLAPLAEGEQGAGTDLRSDYSPTSLYQQLRDARAAARAEERARDADADEGGAEAEGWRDVLAVGQTALSEQTKDLEIAAWMTEALVRMHGLAGLTSGARLMAGLCDNFWDAVFPLPDEEGLEGRASPIGGLSGASADGTIMQPLRRLPLFRRADGTGVGLYLWDQSEQAEALDPKRKQARHEAGVAELKTLEAEARLDRVYLTGVGRAANAAMAAWKELDRVLDARFGGEAPSVRKVGSLLERMVEVITRLGGVDDAPQAAAVEGASAPGAAAGEAGVAGAPAAGNAVMTRESALRELDRIAEYFRRTEPHSPLAYTLEEAVRRGRMNLSELLQEVLPDQGVRNDMLMRLGMRPEPSE